MSGDGAFRWWWAIGIKDAEFYNGPCETRDQAIAEARGDDGDEYGFVIIEADRSVPKTTIFDAGGVFERYNEWNEECWGEDGADIDCTREQELDLEAMLAAAFDEWFKKHGIERRGWAFGTTRNQETFQPITNAAETEKIP